ncbi:MAG: hypothetical protein AB8F74_08015 [Saprospiraceae bacterium]
MFPKIRLLFVGAPSKATIEHQKLLATESLPISGSFEATVEQAVTYLNSCSQEYFPDVILLDEKLGELELDSFFQSYRQYFYMHQLDTLLFIHGSEISEADIITQYPQIAGYLSQPLSKFVFLKEIYSKISFTMM